jgi:hypothetical protein
VKSLIDEESNNLYVKIDKSFNLLVASKTDENSILSQL